MPPSKKNKLQITKYCFLWLKIFIVFIFFFSLPGLNIYEPPVISQQKVNFSRVPLPALYPENTNSLPLPKLSAEGIIILDLGSSVVLYEKDSHKRFPPASTTKIITALVALENYQLDQVLTVKTPVTEGRIMNLVPGEKITMENLLYGALVHSANDAAFTLAENFPGGVNAFVDEMNKKIKSLGLTDTNITNPIGFEDDNQYTTAYDLAQISRIALRNGHIKKITGTKSITVSDVTYSTFHTLDNVNTLLGKVPGVSGVKTGYTQQAKEVLATVVKRQDKEILIVLLKSNDRFGETENLINWAFNNFKWVDLWPTGLTTQD